MADYAADAAALLDHVGWERCARRRHQLRRDGRPGARRHVAGAVRAGWRSCARRPAARGGSSYPLHELAELPPAEAAAIGAAAARHPVHAGVARRRTRTTGRSSRCARRSAVRRQSAEERRGELAQLGARRGHDVWDRLRARSPARRSSPAAATTASPRRRTARRSRRGSPAPSCGCTRAATSSSSRTVPRSPDHPRLPRRLSRAVRARRTRRLRHGRDRHAR